VGIEPTYKGFADLSLTTWVPRLGLTVYRNFVAVSAAKLVESGAHFNTRLQCRSSAALILGAASDISSISATSRLSRQTPHHRTRYRMCNSYGTRACTGSIWLTICRSIDSSDCDSFIVSFSRCISC
jgi:hypothetical protein